MTQWFIKLGDEEHGPLSAGRLKQLAGQERITLVTLVRRASDEQWVKARQVKGLFEAATSAAGEAKPPVAGLRPADDGFNDIVAGIAASDQSPFHIDALRASADEFVSSTWRPHEMTWLDRQFAGTQIVSIIILFTCLSIAVLPFGLIGLATCQHPEAEKHASLMILIPLGMIALGMLNALM